jgi:hypothetical protein
MSGWIPEAVPLEAKEKMMTEKTNGAPSAGTDCAPQMNGINSIVQDATTPVQLGSSPRVWFTLAFVRAWRLTGLSSQAKRSIAGVLSTAALEAEVLRAMASDPLVPYHALTDSTIQLTPAAAPLGDLHHA